MKWTVVAIVAVIGMIHVQESSGMPLEKLFPKFPTIPDNNSLLDVFQNQVQKTIKTTSSLAKSSASNEKRSFEIRNPNGSTVKTTSESSSSYALAAAQTSRIQS